MQRFSHFTLALFLAGSLAQAASPTLKHPAVKIRGAVFHVEVARTPDEWRQGLMYRERLGARDGMLFWGQIERPQSFWMKNTLVPLDIIFISKSLRIVSIARNAKPLSEAPIPSEAPAQYVLEILADQARLNSLRPGDRVEFVNLQ